MSTWQTAEAELYTALSAVADAYHVALNGVPADGKPMIVYRIDHESLVTESNVPIMATIYADAYVYQYDYSETLMDAVVQALQDAGWYATRSNQTLDNGFYRDSLSAAKRFTFELEE